MIDAMHLSSFSVWRIEKNKTLSHGMGNVRIFTYENQVVGIMSKQVGTMSKQLVSR